MNSINREQSEENYKDLFNDEAAMKIKELCEKAKTCFFCTGIRSGSQFYPRPMAVQKIDDDGTCWFLSAADSYKNQEILLDPFVQLLFQTSTHAGFISLYGEAHITKDKVKIKELWEPLLKTWFTEGEQDPRITVIEFIPETGYYWDTKHGRLVAFAKQVAGSILGKTMDDSIEGKLEL